MFGIMRFCGVAYLALIVLSFFPLTMAHFTLLHPPTVYNVAGVIPSIPKCGYDPYPMPSDITGIPPIFSLEHGQIAITTHGDGAWRIRIVFDPIKPGGRGTRPFIDLYPKIKTYGNGTFCVNTIDVPEFTALNLEQYDLEALDGLQGWISIRGTMEDGRFYQCALVTFSSHAPDESSADACMNSTGVEVRYDRNQIGSGETDSGETDNPSFYPDNPNGQGENTTIWKQSTTTIWDSTSMGEGDLWPLAESTNSLNSAPTTSKQVLSDATETSTMVVTRTEVVTSTAISMATSDGIRKKTIGSWDVLAITIGTTLITMLCSL